MTARYRLTEVALFLRFAGRGFPHVEITEQRHAQIIAEAQVIAFRLASLSEQVGLADFARVARDLGACLAVGDRIATGAVSARLLRLGEDSLFSVILYADQSAL